VRLESYARRFGFTSTLSLRLGLPLVATLGREMDILEEEQQDLECASAKAFKSCTAFLGEMREES
jgi:hypothetical protein